MTLEANVVLLGGGQFAEPDDRLPVGSRVLATRAMTRLASAWTLFGRVEQLLAVRQLRPCFRELDVTSETELAADILGRLLGRRLLRVARAQDRANDERSRYRRNKVSMVLHGTDSSTSSRDT